MRLFLFISFLLVSLNADEMQRLESIVKDIEKMRIDYELSQRNLQECQVSLISKQENYTDNEIYINRIKNLENQIKELKKSLKLKTNNKTNIKEKKIIVVKKQIKNEICTENTNNKFPQLKMREKVDKDTSPATYRLNKNSIIYSAIEGKEIDRWEKLTSFTSTLRIGNWVKISGYFVNRQWKKAQKQMWVKASDALKRD